MHENEWKSAYESIGPDAAANERIWNSLMREAGADAAGRSVIRRRHTGKRQIRMVLLAAVLVGAMGATAYAAGLFGTQALTIPEPEFTPQKLVIDEDGKGRQVDNPVDGAVFSITQPQELPENLDPAIRRKVENNKAAWEEWKSWYEENKIQEPDVFKLPEEARASDLIQNEDGDWKLVFTRPNKTDEELKNWVNAIEAESKEHPERIEELNRELSAYYENPDNWVVVEERRVSQEEYAQYQEFLSVSGKYMDSYDYHYLVQTEEQGIKLEEIASQYGLVLRHTAETRFGTLADYYAVHGVPDWMSEEDAAKLQQDSTGLSAEEQLAELSRHCCRGKLFLTPPPYVDHLYWYEEGTFGVNYTWVSENGQLAECYLYNSMYGTLSSGLELFRDIEDVDAYTTRAYITEDGTEVTILESEHENAWGHRDAAFLYVFLPDSFLVIQVENPDGLSPAELEKIADSVNFAEINRSI